MQRFALFNILLTLLVITLGALTRLLDAGLGCPDWPVCYGHPFPISNEAAIEFTQWQFDSGKAWMEMIHRYAASALGLSILIQAALIWPRYLGALRWLAVFLCVWVVLQGLFGMWTVTLRLWPPVVSAHLLGGAVTLGAQFLIWRVITSNREPQWRSWWSAFALIIIFQMALGAWTSSHYAGLACPDFPTCQGNWWVEINAEILHSPMVEGDEYLGGIGSNHQRMAIQWVHRLGALAVLLLFILLVFKYPLQKRRLAFCGSILFIQISLGILNAVWLLPLSLALLHNTFAMLLWLGALNGLLAMDELSDEKYFAKELLA
ncbi:COX15/CtaA family protein [Oceaniserpentilla sp. 4NH20-0058]|uniref:COX15/CtaA family protein n=1 Tax=Oceaniserpentilla sp. 4NH20-0058 TaxID=3127660 RepID=UPI003109A293